MSGQIYPSVGRWPRLTPARYCGAALLPWRIWRALLLLSSQGDLARIARAKVRRRQPTICICLYTFIQASILAVSSPAMAPRTSVLLLSSLLSTAAGLTTCPGFPGFCSESFPGQTCNVVCSVGRNNVPLCQVGLLHGRHGFSTDFEYWNI